MSCQVLKRDVTIGRHTTRPSVSLPVLLRRILEFEIPRLFHSFSSLSRKWDLFDGLRLLSVELGLAALASCQSSRLHEIRTLGDSLGRQS